MGPTSIWWDVAMYGAVFTCGAVMVKRGQELLGRRQGGKAGGAGRPGAAPLAAPARPANQLLVLGFQDLVKEIGAEVLLKTIEKKTRLSQGNWQRDCQPVVEAFAEFVQRLPASESHHHAQPGGLLQHALEVADAALTFRSGMEIPQGASTEDRKRDEHRWTVAILIGALLHDVGKPVTDTRVTLFQADPRLGQAWQPMAGPMRSFSAHAYSVAFADPSERDYKAHAKLGAMLLQSMVPQRTRRWLSEEGGVLDQLLEYLSGDAPDGVIGDIIKKADSDSVSRNLMHGPRTRFASARTRPLIERLMQALRRMLAEGAQLPLNRPGAAGWVHDGCLWFVCARLADEVRDYLAQHESGQGIPGKDKNDRIFDTWQEHGAVRPAPDGGAVWRVRVRCETWSPPDALTVLCFPLDKLYEDPAKYPAPVNGEVVAVSTPAPGAAAAAHAGPAAGPAAPAAAVPASSTPLPAALQVPVSLQPATPATGKPPSLDQRIEPVFLLPPTPAASTAPVPAAVPGVQAGPAPKYQQPGRRMVSMAEALAAGLEPEDLEEAPPPPAPAARVVAVPATARVQPPSQPAMATVMASPPPISVASPAVPAVSPSPPQTAPRRMDDVLDPAEAADLNEGVAHATETPTLTLTAPLRPRERNAGHPQPAKMPSPAATAFLAWVAQAVGSGDLLYNQDGAMVHFVPEGALLLSPGIFNRFLEVHRALDSGPVAELRATHGDNAYKRLQNELAKSGFTLRNGDENLHYFQFVKADGQLSRIASFYLLRQPELLWNPVPKHNDRIRRAGRAPGPTGGPKALKLPAGGVSIGKGARPEASADKPKP